MNGFWIGMGAVILLVIVLFAIPTISAILGQLRDVPAAPAGEAAGAAAPAPAGEPLYKKPLVWVGVIGAIVVLVLFFNHGTGVALAAAVILAAVVLVVQGKGGVWLAGAVAFCAVMIFLFGDKTPEVVKKVQKGASEVALEGKISLPDITLPGSGGAQQQRVPQQSRLVVFPARVVDGSEMPEVLANTVYPMRVTTTPQLLEGRTGFCLDLSTYTSPEVARLEVMVRGASNESGWLPVEEFMCRLAKRDPTLPFKGARWYSIRSNGEPFNIKYEYLYTPSGVCPVAEEINPETC